MTLADYEANTTPFFAENDFYEVETSRRIDLFGNIAHVWSGYEARRSPDDAQPERRGINSIQLFRDPDPRLADHPHDLGQRALSQSSSPHSRLAGTATSIILGCGRLSAAMIATNSSSVLPPPRRGLRAFSWPMLLTRRC